MKKMTLSTLKTFLLWLLIVPPGITYIYFNYPPKEYSFMAIILFIILGFLTVSFPIMRNEKAIFLVMWITVPVFVSFGIMIEIIVMQVAILAVLFTPTTHASVLNRLLFNSLLFYILSVVAAVAFYFVGGVSGSLNFWSLLLAAFCYQLVHTILNDVIINLFARNANKESIFYSKDLVVNLGKVIVMVPFMLTLYFLFQYVGVAAIFLIAVPYFFATILLRQNSITAKVNVDLQIAGELGQSFSADLTVDEVMNEYMIKASDMLGADYAYLYKFEYEKLNLIRAYDKKEFLPQLVPESILLGEGISGNVFLNNKPVIYNARDEWQSYIIHSTPRGMESVVCIPIIRNKATVGVLLLGSNHKQAFHSYQLQILDLLSSYFSVAVEKARYLENVVTQMEYCALTKLHNYRYLNKKLIANLDRVKNQELTNLSVVLLDIDFFKKVNDSYGHQSGNDILCALANLLKENLPEEGIIARYGGEEFVYLLPNFSKKRALIFAEEIRLEIEQATFNIISDLGLERKEKEVRITISAGVSAALEDTDEAKVLLRNADRALYIGAKQLGRNRVAEYVK